MAEEEPLNLIKLDGTEYVLSAVDDFAVEVEALRQNAEFMDFLARRARSTQRVSLAEARLLSFP